MESFHILGIDPGFASLGFAVVTLSKEGIVATRNKQGRPVMGVLETEKSDKKRQVKASDDNIRRARELTKQLLMTLALPDLQIKAICAEAMSFPRSSSSSQKLGICWGIVSALSELYNLPVIQSSPQEIKQLICGRKDASKEEIQEALAHQFSLDLDSFKKSNREHCFDALGAVVASMDSELMRMLTKMLR